MEEHFWTQESLIPDINIYWLASVAGLVVILLELVAQEPVTFLIFFFFVVLFELLGYIFTDISVLFFDGSGDFEGVFTWHGFFSVTKLLEGKFCDVSSGERDVLDA